MAPARAKKDASWKKEGQDELLITSRAKEKRGWRATARTCIENVMEAHNKSQLSLSSLDLNTDMKSSHDKAKMTASNSSISLENAENQNVNGSDVRSFSKISLDNNSASEVKAEDTSSTPVVKESPSKSWTNSIWEDSSQQEKSVTEAATISNDLKVEPNSNSEEQSVTRFSSRVAAKSLSQSSGSTPSTTSSTPRSNSPETLSRAGRTSVNRTKKKTRIKRRIRSDSEDSSVSTDSPLKPKTYTENTSESNEGTPVSKKSARIPKKKKEAETVMKSVDENRSPEEEPPLIPKGFLEQQKKEQELRERLEDPPLVKMEGEQGEQQRKETEAEAKLEVERRIKSFKQLKENQYLCKKYVNKETRKLQCECVLSKDEIQQGSVGCGEDCLNRLIYIECGKYCLLENNCSNKRFQNNIYADVEVFKTDWKGVGLRARSNIPRDTFIMEYVGEVLDTKLFKKRAKNYSKDGVKHFYFMALSKDQFVDATLKGNISRFINHSCEPNAETQKWTVNGEIRVGFFTTKNITAGEEICFDYKFERYGNVAQECFCGAENCKRWIGGEPTSDSGIEEIEEWSEDDEEEEEEMQETAKKETKKKEKKRREKKPKKYEVDDFEEELERLMSTGVRNKMQTVQLCRLMVRATQPSKPHLADLLVEADQACLRLFLDYQGLKILYSWMFMLGWSVEDLNLKLKIESVLSAIHFPHKTMLIETKVYDTVERWQRDSPSEVKDEGMESTPVSRATTPTPAQSRVSTPEDLEAASDIYPRPEVQAEMCVGAVLKAQAEVGEEKQDSLELESEKLSDGVPPVAREQLPLTEIEQQLLEDVSGEARQVEVSLEQKMVQEIQARARDLLEAWAGLVEMFRIPKKERQAERREHEREADRREEGEKREEGGARRMSSSYRSYQEPHTGHGVMRGGYSAHPPPTTGNRRNLRLDDRTGRLCKSNLHRDDRRMLFQAKVEEETRQKVLRNAISARHEQCCKLLGLDPASTALLPKYPEFYLSAGKWIPMPPPPHSIDPKWEPPMMAALPAEAFKPGDYQLPNPRSFYPPGCCPEPPVEILHKDLDMPGTEAEICAYYDKLYYGSRASSPLSAAIDAQLERRRHVSGESVDISPDYRSPSPVNRSASPPRSIPFLSSSSAQDGLLQTHREEESCHHQDQDLTHEVKSSSLSLGPHQPRTAAGDGGSGLVVRLPPRWRAARDTSGRVYYYHCQTKETQWEPPSEERQEEQREGCDLQETKQSYRVETTETDSEEEQGEEGEDTDTEEDSEEETEDNGAPEPEPEVGEIPDSDLSASEKRMLLRMRRRTKEERRNMRRLKREKFKERHEQERLVTRERHKRHRRDGLVEEHIVPARISDKDKVDLMTFKEMRERLLNKDKIREEQLKEEREEEERERREERSRVEKIKREERRLEKIKREKDARQVAGEEQMDISLDLSMSEVQSTPQPSVSSTSSARTTQAAADTSSDVEKKHKEKFLKEMSKLVVKILDPYRKKGVKGYISKTDDFKHLAKKLTFTIMHKELKVCKNIEELRPNEKVKKKASDYVSKYMKKYDREYRRSPNGGD